jgi:HD-GYP domain-containing protein (c-di-GMP phosphodiesterase class II)
MVCLQATALQKKILVLHSYSDRFRWVNSINEGIILGLPPEDWDIRFEYLDAKELPYDFDYGLFDGLLSVKYAKTTFDLLISVDDPAYRYLEKTGTTVFRAKKYIAIGLNAPPAKPVEGTSYIIENPDYAKTINFALDRHPKATTVHIVSDRSISGTIAHKTIESSQLSRQVSFDWIDDDSPEKILARCQSLSKEEILIYTLYFNPAYGYGSNDRISEKIAETAKAPIYGFWVDMLPRGGLGGYLYDGTRLGLKAADIAKAISAKNASPIYYDKPLSTWEFNWNTAQRFNLSEADFPQGTMFVGKPIPRISVGRTEIATIFMIFGVLLVVIILVSVSLHTKRRLVAYKESLIATQRELMASLGDVIETRSEETASHASRITRLSTRLGARAGLSHENLEKLAICAAMHDIGKVGIPDDILKKTGLLSPEEIAIMRSHTTIGYSIFHSSPNAMFQAAAVIALEHHEKWDGSGYPDGKKREEIDILARIVAIVDVFDALLSDRTYKRAWEPETVREYIAAESGLSFDPVLSTVFLEFWDDFMLLRNCTTDSTFDPNATIAKNRICTQLGRIRQLMHRKKNHKERN